MTEPSSAHHPRARWENRLLALGLVGLTVLLCTEAVVSLRWRMVHDTPLLHYAAWQIAELGKAPYEQVLETSLPGSLIAHIAIGKIFGWGDLGFQLANLSWLAALLSLTWAVLRRIDVRVAWAAVVLYGLSYFANGPWMVLQRDGATLLPIAAALWMATSRWGHRRRASVFVGLAFGCAVAVKPHLAIGFPIIAIFPWLKERSDIAHVWRPAFAGVAWGLLGMVLPVVLSLAWVVAHGATGAFVEIVREYLPLHLHLSGDHAVIEGAARFPHLVRGIGSLGGHALWLAPLFLVATQTVDPSRERGQRAMSALLGPLALTYAIYPALAGQFWSYHWMPFQYFAAIAAAMMLAPCASSATAAQRAVPVFLFAAFVVVQIRPDPNFLAEVAGAPILAPKDGRVDTIASFLETHMEDGDTVQPLDWSGGAVHAMLIAEAQCASRFVYDYHFYHDLDEPVVQRWRAQFLDHLEATEPTWVIRFDGPRVFGEGTSHEWEALDRVLQDAYTTALDGNGFEILEHH